MLFGSEFYAVPCVKISDKAELNVPVVVKPFTVRVRLIAWSARNRADYIRIAKDKEKVLVSKLHLGPAQAEVFANRPCAPYMSRTVGALSPAGCHARIPAQPHSRRQKKS